MSVRKRGEKSEKKGLETGFRGKETDGLSWPRQCTIRGQEAASKRIGSDMLK